MYTSIQPIILCGGSGTRLWPLSNNSVPKQFIKIGDKGSLLEQTIKRVNLVTNECKKYRLSSYDPILIMHKNHKIPEELSIYKSNIVYEDYANDTAVAVAKACFAIKDKYPNQNVIMLVLPADHYIENNEAFVSDISSGISNVTDDNIVLFGIQPTSPETKYGYIIPDEDGVKFKEKPSYDIALELIKRKALWNSGIFASKVNTVFNALSTSPYNIFDWITNPRPDKAPSFDIAVLQSHPNIYSHYCLKWKWSDVGTWESFIEIPEVKEEISSSSSVITKNCSDVNILNRTTGNIVVIGCDNLLIVSAGDDILIMPNNSDYNNELKEIASSFAK